MLQIEWDIQRKLRILRHDEQIGNVSKTVRAAKIFEIEVFYVMHFDIHWQVTFIRIGLSQAQDPSAGIMTRPTTTTSPHPRNARSARRSP
jgi:hypothetical protein